MDLINQGWQRDFIACLNLNGIQTVQLPSDNFTLLRLNDSDKLLVNLLSVDQHAKVEELIQLRECFALEQILVVQLWQDVWITKPAQVFSRISSMLGLNRSIHGRKTKLLPVKQEIANDFFNKYHLQGTVRCKYRFGLMLEEKLVAVAGFSGLRPMNHTDGYHSVELVRFATLNGITVTGGMSKLIKHMVAELKPNDVMSYADRDWSDGNGYTRLGFTLAGHTAPMQIFMHQTTMERCFPHRLPAALQLAIAPMEEQERLSCLEKLNYIPVFNTGNLKYILYL